MNEQTKSDLKSVLARYTDEDFSGNHDYTSLSPEQKLRALSSLARFTTKYGGSINSRWDDIPEKIIGNRKVAEDHTGSADALQQLAEEMGRGRITWPKGVFRFKSHEEADQWWIRNMIQKK